MPRAYYNELDKEKAAWLRELIKAGVIADGDVDERSILDVQPGDLAGYTQCHFFAGIGVWSYALRRAGIGDDERVWTGSCPCPSFSSAGKGQGFDDARHLWPDWARLIRECKPPRIFGEQADDAVGYGWLDLVQTDLEKADYAVGKAVLASASVGASDIRERLYWVAYANGGRCEQRIAEIRAVREFGAGCELGGLAYALRERGCGRQSWDEPGLGIPDGNRSAVLHPFSNALKGFWRDADWLLCTDGKWRPVEPGTFPLVNGAPARLGRLRGYGDAINAELAQAFIECCEEARPGPGEER